MRKKQKKGRYSRRDTAGSQENYYNDTNSQYVPYYKHNPISHEYSDSDEYQENLTNLLHRVYLQDQKEQQDIANGIISTPNSVIDYSPLENDVQPSYKSPLSPQNVTPKDKYDKILDKCYDSQHNNSMKIGNVYYNFNNQPIDPMNYQNMNSQDYYPSAYSTIPNNQHEYTSEPYRNEFIKNPNYSRYSSDLYCNTPFVSEPQSFSYNNYSHSSSLYSPNNNTNPSLSGSSYMNSVSPFSPQESLNTNEGIYYIDKGKGVSEVYRVQLSPTTSLSNTSSNNNNNNNNNNNHNNNNIHPTNEIHNNTSPLVSAKNNSFNYNNKKSTLFVPSMTSSFVHAEPTPEETEKVYQQLFHADDKDESIIIENNNNSKNICTKHRELNQRTTIDSTQVNYSETTDLNLNQTDNQSQNQNSIMNENYSMEQIDTKSKNSEPIDESENIDESESSEESENSEESDNSEENNEDNEDPDEYLPTFLLEEGHTLDEGNNPSFYSAKDFYTETEDSVQLLNNYQDRTHIKSINQIEILKHINSFVNNKYLKSYSYLPISQQTSIQKILKVSKEFKLLSKVEHDNKFSYITLYKPSHYKVPLSLTRKEQKKHKNSEKQRNRRERASQKDKRKKEQLLQEAQSVLQNPIPVENKGHQLLCKLGWNGGGLGKEGQGIIEPVPVIQKKNKYGLGSNCIPQNYYESLTTNNSLYK